MGVRVFTISSGPQILRITMKINVTYNQSRSKDTYTKTEQFCPNCGSKTLFESDAEDYYAGPTVLCVTCNYKHNICSQPVDAMYLEIIDQLKKEF
jgi:hypothetical protein